MSKKPITLTPLINFSMADKHKLSRSLEKLEGEISMSIHARTTQGDEVRESKAFLDFYYGNLQWNTVGSFQKRITKLIAEFPQFSDLAETVTEVVRISGEIAAIVAADKARKQAKRDRPKPIKLDSGVEITARATHEDVKILLAALGSERAEHIERGAAGENNRLDIFIKRAADGTISPDMFRAIGIYPERDRGNWAGCIERLNSSELRNRLVASARRDAACEFDSFVVKLADKIAGTETGPVKSASLAGSAWSGSGLTVTTTEKQVWVTKCIINHSPLGRAFHQWPTIRKQ